MKKILLFVVLCLFVRYANAQFLFGARIGIASSTVKVDEDIVIESSEYSLKESNSIFGYHIGVFGRIESRTLFFQPELLYTSSGGQVVIKNKTLDSESVRRQEFKRLDLPLIVGYKLGNIRLQTGPVASLMLSNVSDIIPGYENKFTQFTWGLQFGIGVDLSKVIVELKYENNFGLLGSSFDVDGQAIDFESRNNQLIFSVGYLIFK